MTPSVLNKLRQVLAEAEKGEVTAIAIATCGPELETGSAYALGDATLAELLGSIELMKHRLLRDGTERELD